MGVTVPALGQYFPVTEDTNLNMVNYCQEEILESRLDYLKAMSRSRTSLISIEGINGEIIPFGHAWHDKSLEDR